MTEQTPWLTPSEAARMLTLSVRHVQRLFDEGRITGVKTPLGRLVDRASAERELERRMGLTDEHAG